MKEMEEQMDKWKEGNIDGQVAGNRWTRKMHRQTGERRNRLAEK